MSSTPRLRTKGETVINFTNRIDIKPSQILFEVATKDERTFRYRITIRTWAALAGKVSARYNMTLQFDRGGEPAQRVNLENAERVIRGGGSVTGEIDGGFDPAALGVKVIVSDPARGHMIVIAGVKGKPDIDDADIPDVDAPEPQRIVPIRKTAGKGDGLINVYESDDVAGGWNLKLRNVECPHLVVSPAIGKEAVVNDPRTQRLVFPEIVRRILSELALHPDTYEAEPWAKVWRRFGEDLSGIGDWSYYVGEEGEPEVDFVHSRVDDGVRRYCERHLSPADAPAGQAAASNEE